MRKFINLLLMIIAGVLFWLLMFSVIGCEVLKHKKSITTDSTSSHKTDTVRLLVKDTSSRIDASWYREILNYLPQGKDTVINNTTVPVNTYYPTQVIREGGTFTKEEYLHLLDSMNSRKVDTTHVNTQLATVDKKTKVLSFWQMIAAMAGVLIVFEVLKWAKSNISIKKIIK